MPFDRTRTLRGALAGAVAAGVWVAQQPVDKRVFGTAYDDVEILGKAVTRSDWWPAAGVALHVGNGAVFGAVYSTFAAGVPVPPWARGPLTALAEHAVTWPLSILTDRLHPARRELPALWGDTRALAASTWRHVLFGVVMGELDRRLNPPAPEAEPVDAVVVSTNGHGSLEHLVGAES